MSVVYRTGDLLSSSARVLVAPVNCVEVAGRGLALEFKRRYPVWFDSHWEVCQSGRLVPGKPVLHMFPGNADKTLADILERGGSTSTLMILDFPTKRHWRDGSRIEDIEAGLQWFGSGSGPGWVAPWLMPEMTMAFPKLGCGLGGLSWDEVRPLMEHYLGQLVCEVMVYV